MMSTITLFLLPQHKDKVDWQVAGCEQDHDGDEHFGHLLPGVQLHLSVGLVSASVPAFWEKQKQKQIRK